jgi:hypothetical protein
MATARRLKLEAEAQKAAVVYALLVPHEGQGNPDEWTMDPGREPILASDGVALPPSREEGCVAKRDIPDHSLMVMADGGDTVGSASGTRIPTPKRRRKKSSFMVRKGASKRKGAL